MKKKILIGLLVAVVLPLASCVSSTYLNKSAAYVPLAEAAYNVGGETVGQASVDYIFFIPSGEPNFGWVGAGPSWGDSRAVSEAKFDALSKVQGATSFMITDINVENDGSFLSYTKTATVKGRAITYTGPAR